MYIHICPCSATLRSSAGRVYTGTGGCRRHGYGVLSCASEFQIMYSLSAGLSSGTHDTTFYAGNIRAIDGNHLTGRLHDGTELDNQGLIGMQVATVSKSSGAPRALNYPITATNVAARTGSAATTAGALSAAYQISDLLTGPQMQIIVDNFESAQSAALAAGEELNHVQAAVQSILSVATSEQTETIGAGSGAMYSMISTRRAFDPVLSCIRLVTARSIRPAEFESSILYSNSERRGADSSVGCEVSVTVVPVLTCIRQATARTACRYGDFDLELRPATFLLHDHLCRPIELWEIDDFPFHRLSAVSFFRHRW